MKSASLILNVAYTQYPVVQKVAKKELEWNISSDESSDNWNILWSDGSITTDKLVRMTPD
jgi:hypothetical protein